MYADLWPYQTGIIEEGKLYAEERTTDSLELRWARIDNADHYGIRLEDRIFTTESNSMVLQGLDSGTLYSPTFLVRYASEEMPDYVELDDSFEIYTSK